jgi:hypothetical protein
MAGAAAGNDDRRATPQGRYPEASAPVATPPAFVSGFETANCLRITLPLCSLQPNSEMRWGGSVRKSVGRHLRPRDHRRRDQWLRHRPRRCRARPVGLSLRAIGSGQRHLVRRDQVDPWRPALSRELRIPVGARGAGGARGAVADGTAHHLAFALRSPLSPRPAAGMAAAPWALHLRSSRRAPAAAGHPHTRSHQGRDREAAETGPIQARIAGPRTRASLR